MGNCVSNDIKMIDDDDYKQKKYITSKECTSKLFIITRRVRNGYYENDSGLKDDIIELIVKIVPDAHMLDKFEPLKSYSVKELNDILTIILHSYSLI